MTAVAQPRGARTDRKPVPTSGHDEWTEVAEHWLERAPQSLWRRHSDAVNSILIERWLPRHMIGRVLKTDLFDEAVATGLYPALSRHARSVVALDISPTVSRAATTKYPKLGGFSADVRSLPADSAAFDAIVSLSTLDHFETEASIATALGELFRVLKPGGTLILTLDNAKNPVIAARNRLPYALTHSLGLVPYPVGKTLTPHRAVAATRGAGFSVVECTAIMHAPRVLAIPLMSRLDRAADTQRRAILLRAAMRFESLAKLPSRFLTGHFIAIRAVKPPA
jgi:SAM-dependent methyltransferase